MFFKIDVLKNFANFTGKHLPFVNFNATSIVCGNNLYQVFLKFIF